MLAIHNHFNMAPEISRSPSSISAASAGSGKLNIFQNINQLSRNKYKHLRARFSRNSLKALYSRRPSDSSNNISVESLPITGVRRITSRSPAKFQKTESDQETRRLPNEDGRLIPQLPKEESSPKVSTDTYNTTPGKIYYYDEHIDDDLNSRSSLDLSFPNIFSGLNPSVKTSAEIAGTVSNEGATESARSPNMSEMVNLIGNLTASDDEKLNTPSANSLVWLFQKNRNLLLELDWPQFFQRLHHVIAANDPKSSAALYRLLRYAIRETPGPNVAISKYLEYDIARSLASTLRQNSERDQAMKLVRTLYMKKEPDTIFSPFIIKAIVAVAENSDDSYRPIALETLAEILLIDTENALRNDSLKCILEACSNDCTNPFLTTILMHPVSYILNFPKFRSNIQPDSELGPLLLPLLEIIYDPETDKIQTSISVVSTLLNSWAGFFALCFKDLSFFRSVIQSLQVRSASVKATILDFFAHIIGVELSETNEELARARRILGINDRINSDESQLRSTVKLRSPQKASLVQVYRSLIMLVLLQSGIIESLTDCIESDDCSPIQRKATLLLAEMLLLSSRYLPDSYSIQAQRLSRLFETASQFKSGKRLAAVSAFATIDKLGRLKGKQTSNFTLKSQISPNDSTYLENERESRQVSEVKIKLGFQTDALHFRQLLMDTQVLATKDFYCWKWDILIEIFSGPLRNPTRLDEAIKQTKFMRRIMSFYRPFKYRFSKVPKIPANYKFVKAGCVLMSTLLRSQEGCRYLQQNKMLRQIAECLAQLDPVSGISAQEPLFSSGNLKRTLSSGYIEMLGTIFQSDVGLQMMAAWRMFTILHHIFELRSREDLVEAFIKNLNYNRDGHCRILLTKALANSDTQVRLYIVQHLGSLLQQDQDDESYESPTDLCCWILRILMSLLYDTNTAVTELAVKILEEELSHNCSSLKYAISLQPCLEYTTELSEPVIFIFLSNTEGFKYLDEMHYVERELDNWFQRKNLEYVSKVDMVLNNTLGAENKHLSSVLTSDGTASKHFFAEVARTEQGCQLLLRHKYFGEFVNVLQICKGETSDLAIIKRLKSSLWAVGHIGSSVTGFNTFLNDSIALQLIVEIAEQNAVCSVRGTAFFVLGLLAMTAEGRARLEKLGWFGVSFLGSPMGICVPKNLLHFLTIDDQRQRLKLTEGMLQTTPASENKSGANTSTVTDISQTTVTVDGSSNPTEANGLSTATAINSSSTRNGARSQVRFSSLDEQNRLLHADQRNASVSESKYSSSSLAEDQDEIDERHCRQIIQLICNLSNHITFVPAVSRLMKMKRSDPEIFYSGKLLEQAMNTLATYKFAQPARKFLFELFDETIHLLAADPSISNSNSPIAKKNKSATADMLQGSFEQQCRIATTEDSDDSDDGGDKGVNDQRSEQTSTTDSS